jgi:hypothetical protein
LISRILVASSVVALAIVAVAGAQAREASRASGKPLGVVPPQVDGKLVGSWAGSESTTTGTGPTKTDNLTYDGLDQSGTGPVMHTNKVYTIFWVPSGFGVPSTYKSTVNRFFQDVAADSGKTTNVYSSDMQYTDTKGAIQYKSTYGGSYTDTLAFPPSDCTAPSDVSGTKACLSDAALRTEIVRVATAKGWPHGPGVEFFLFTAHNVESCYDSLTCSYDYYCAYHDSFGTTSGEYIYANMPFPNQTFDYGSGITSSPCSGSGQGYPNSGGAGGGTDAAAADEVINVASHEHNEAITDPTGDAWWVDNPGSTYSGYENGDLCAWYFPASAVLGGSGTSRYNQAINGSHYFVQGEWSNASATSTGNSGCVWSYTPIPANKTRPSISGVKAQGSLLTGVAGAWTNTPTSYTYRWQRCDTAGANCSLITTTTTSATSTTYTLAAADVGHTIVLRVVAANAYGSSNSSASAPTAVVAAGKPVSSAPPTITGTALVGQALSGSAGTWSNAPTSYEYDWLRCDSAGSSCTLITSKTTSATTTSYTPGSPDLGHRIRLRVTAANAAGSGASATSAATGTVGAKPANTAAPTIGGTAAVGQTLTASAGTWKNGVTSYTYQWFRCSNTGTNCMTVASATSPSTTMRHTILSGDLGHTFFVKVKATNAYGSSPWVSSAQTGIVRS